MRASGQWLLLSLRRGSSAPSTPPPSSRGRRGGAAAALFPSPTSFPFSTLSSSGSASPPSPSRLPSDDAHPVLDCSVLFAEDDRGRREGLDGARDRLIVDIRRALTRCGYFYASNVCSLPAEYISSVYEYHEKLHGLPLSVKRDFIEPRGTYTGLDLGIENAELPYETGTTSTVRAWDYSRTNFKSKKSKYPPEEVISPSFETFLDDLYERQNRLGEVLMSAFEDMLGLRKDTFGQHFRTGDMGTIRLLYYPGAEQETLEEANRGISAHTVKGKTKTLRTYA